MERSEIENASLEFIGVIHSPHTNPRGTPIQPAYAGEHRGRVVLSPREGLSEALDDLEGFERIWLIYWFHRAGPFKPHVVPYRDRHPHGLFATRAPNRPNPIGLSVVRLLGRQGNVLTLGDVDILDGTPLVDIKPYVPEFDVRTPSKAGWLDARREDRRVADDRFHDDDNGQIGEPR